jgi:hypothetical protein
VRRRNGKRRASKVKKKRDATTFCCYSSAHAMKERRRMNLPVFFFFFVIFFVVFFSFCIALEGEGGEQQQQQQQNAKDGIPVPNTINVDPFSIKQISWYPNAVRYEGFLSNSECDYLIESYHSDENNNNNNDNMKGSRLKIIERESSVVEDIERRIAEWTHTPSSHGEKLRVVKHDLRTTKTSLKPLYSEVYSPFEYEKNVGRINDMHLGTVVLVLKDESVKDGEEEFSSNGVIMFPNGAGGGNSDSPTRTCEDIDASLFLKAKRGDAIAWLHTTRDQKVDGNATGVGECVYAGGKVGEKWTAVKYLHLVTTQK